MAGRSLANLSAPISCHSLGLPQCLWPHRPSLFLSLGLHVAVLSTGNILPSDLCKAGSLRLSFRPLCPRHLLSEVSCPKQLYLKHCHVPPALPPSTHLLCFISLQSTLDSKLVSLVITSSHYHANFMGPKTVSVSFSLSLYLCLSFSTLSTVPSKVPGTKQAFSQYFHMNEYHYR